MNRGKVEIVNLARAVLINDHLIWRARIEIDHINYGLNDKTGLLNSKRRSRFSVKDIEKFIYLLDGEDVVPIGFKQSKMRFMIRIDCPVNGEFHGQDFLMIFEMDYRESDLINTITLYKARG